MTPLKTRFIKEIGTRIFLRQYWGSECSSGSCHNAMLKLRDELHPLILTDKDHIGGYPSDYHDEMWPKLCEDCGQPAPADATKQVFNKRLYNTASGFPELGNLWYAHWMPLNWEWDNKTDYNLMAMTPDGWEWNIDSRAANCALKEDRLHRCWCRHGDPETGDIHVDKNGLTCQAGGGSIQTKGYHGFLHNGFFT